MKIATSTERLKELFSSDPRSDTAIAADLGVSKQAVSSWRTGVRSPKKTIMIKIAEIYHVSIEWLMGFDVDKDMSRIPTALQDSSKVMQVIMRMPPEDYHMVWEAIDRNYKRLKEKGEIE